MNTSSLRRHEAACTPSLDPERPESKREKRECLWPSVNGERYRKQTGYSAALALGRQSTEDGPKINGSNGGAVPGRHWRRHLVVARSPDVRRPCHNGAVHACRHSTANGPKANGRNGEYRLGHQSTEIGTDNKRVSAIPRSYPSLNGRRSENKRIKRRRPCPGGAPQSTENDPESVREFMGAGLSPSFSGGTVRKETGDSAARCPRDRGAASR
jgi:hypothetical protein